MRTFFEVEPKEAIYAFDFYIDKVGYKKAMEDIIYYIDDETLAECMRKIFMEKDTIGRNWDEYRLKI